MKRQHGSFFILVYGEFVRRKGDKTRLVIEWKSAPMHQSLKQLKIDIG